MNTKIDELFSELYPNNPDALSLEINRLYFESLYESFKNPMDKDSILFDGENNSQIIPLPLASEEDLRNISVKDYNSLEEPDVDALSYFGLALCKMQAGLGTSVQRDDLIKKYDNRLTLGSKGTDLFIKEGARHISLAQKQLEIAYDISKKKIFSYVAFVNLVNSETKNAVDKVWDKISLTSKKSYRSIFSGHCLIKYNDIDQLMVPTIDSFSSELTTERVAPAGHAFLGFFEILKLYRMNNAQVKSEIYAIGNGEDIKSNPDLKILSWMIKEDIPVVMITTTKQEKDKKGGQLAVVRGDTPSVTIIEKAQAQKAGQIELFENLGLQNEDKKSLFNTNIVLINKKSLKNILNEIELTLYEFSKVISPDLIKNIKIQSEKEYIQLEGALGSVLLNLDKYCRENLSKNLISFLNLSEVERSRFFMPIKKREDFERMFKN